MSSMTPPDFDCRNGSRLTNTKFGPRHPPNRRGVSGYRERLVLREREREQRAALAGAELSGQEALGPGAPAGRHGDELPAVDLVGARARVVAAAALELPEQVARLGVERVELTGRLAAEQEVAPGGQQRRAHRDVVLPAPPLGAGPRVERADGAGVVLEVHGDARAPVRDALLEVPPPPGRRGADVLDGAVQELRVRV